MKKSNEILLKSSSSLNVADFFKIPRNRRAKFSHVKSPSEQEQNYLTTLKSAPVSPKVASESPCLAVRIEAFCPCS